MTLLQIQDIFYAQSGLVFHRVKTILHGKKYKTISLKAFSGQSCFRPTDYNTDTQEFMEIDSKYTTQLHDVLVRLRSPIQALLIEEDGVGIVVPSHVVILRRKPDMVSTIDLQYFVQYCNSPYVQQTLEYQAKGSSVITMIQIKTLLEHPLPALPSVEKQRKVVQLMEMLEEEQRLLQKLVDLSRQTQKTLQYSIFPISKPY